MFITLVHDNSDRRVLRHECAGRSAPPRKQPPAPLEISRPPEGPCGVSPIRMPPATPPPTQVSPSLVSRLRTIAGYRRRRSALPALSLMIIDTAPHRLRLSFRLSSGESAFVSMEEVPAPSEGYAAHCRHPVSALFEVTNRRGSVHRVAVVVMIFHCIEPLFLHVPATARQEESGLNCVTQESIQTLMNIGTNRDSPDSDGKKHQIFRGFSGRVALQIHDERPDPRSIYPGDP